MKNLLLFPEYRIYRIAQNQNQQNRNILLGLAVLWIILKLGIVSQILVHFLTPYKLTLANIVGIFAMITVVAISTGICLGRVSHHE
jgi:hypothetical protein